ncbi:hypothetical protein DLM_0288 [Aquitalea magnusonii]|uniref:Uncharacterized protein n=1 Tax=Aquitalea magnusonii TaxID=332411 RepID=A0A3G9G903_9NEIS|nr:hypothetical protein DLM_0288 [Aquitalea magnusonii]
MAFCHCLFFRQISVHKRLPAASLPSGPFSRLAGIFAHPPGKALCTVCGQMR